MNILILSVGTRNKIVQYFKKELKGIGKVFATDASPLAPALYEADKFFIVPKIIEPNYIENIIDICIGNNIKGVISLIDPELSLLAKHQEEFNKVGVQVVISSYESIELSFNKFRFLNKLKNNGMNYIRSYIDINEFKYDYEIKEIEFPVFVKPVTGSASINIKKVNSFKQLEYLFNKHDGLMIQEYMTGKEYGADVYIDLLTGELKTIFLKEKLLMRSGETDKSVSVKNTKIEEDIKKLLNIMEYKGVIDVDILEKDGKYYISEVNPRFGGGYPHGYEIGINIPKMIINNLNDKVNEECFNYDAGVYMMKYNEVMIKKIG